MKHSLCLDTFYNESTGKAFTVGMVFDLSSPDPLEVITSESNTESAYIPGEFYKRELQRGIQGAVRRRTCRAFAD